MEAGQIATGLRPPACLSILGLPFVGLGTVLMVLPQLLKSHAASCTDPHPPPAIQIQNLMCQADSGFCVAPGLQKFPQGQ